MKLIALLIGLLVERFATEIFHLRRFRWLDQIIDAGFSYADKEWVRSPLIVVALLALALTLPVLLAVVALGDVLFGFAYLLVAVVVLFFSLGPADIGGQVDDYCEALEEDDPEAIRRSAKAIVERDVTGDPVERAAEVESAVCIQANNRLFAVIFWFVVFGPLGAWGYRATDLIRRRAVFNAGRDEKEGRDSSAIVDAATTLHGWLAWIPARLTALGFALAGSFDDALAAWRTEGDSPERATLSEQNERLLATVGSAALALTSKPDEPAAQRGIRGAIAANGLVLRLLGIWAFVIAAMTLYGASL